MRHMLCTCCSGRTSASPPHLDTPHLAQGGYLVLQAFELGRDAARLIISLRVAQPQISALHCFALHCISLRCTTCQAKCFSHLVMLRSAAAGAMCSKSKAVPARLVAAQGRLGALHPRLCCRRP